MRLILAFLAGYGLAAYAAAHEKRAELHELSDAEVEERTRPNVVPMTTRDWEKFREIIKPSVTWQVDPDYLRPENAGA